MIATTARRIEVGEQVRHHEFAEGWRFGTVVERVTVESTWAGKTCSMDFLRVRLTAGRVTVLAEYQCERCGEWPERRPHTSGSGRALTPQDSPAMVWE